MMSCRGRVCGVRAHVKGLGNQREKLGAHDVMHHATPVVTRRRYEASTYVVLEERDERSLIRREACEVGAGGLDGGGVGREEREAAQAGIQDVKE